MMITRGKRIAQSRPGDYDPNKTFKQAVLENLSDEYTIDGRTFFKGQAVSFLKKALQEKGWRNLGRSYDFEGLCEKNGFKIIPAKNRRGGRATVVTTA
jgi:hypothetical protein